MKQVIAGILLSGIMSQMAMAAELSCTITRTNKHQPSDVATHQYTEEFDAGARRGGVILTGRVESFLLPSNAAVNYGFEIINRRLDTRLSIETINCKNGQQVHFNESFGTLASAPSSVETTFGAGRYSYSVDCWIGE